jgi:rhodanese-related sulfurtransferase
MKRALTYRAGHAACLLAILVALNGCSGSGTNAGPGAGATSTAGSKPVGQMVMTPDGSYTDLTPAQLKGMLDNKDFFLVDVHTPPAGRLPKTDARVAFDQVQQQIDRFPADKNAKIVLTCRSGRMSTEASATLVKLGYTNVYNLQGGMNAWKAAGYEIIPESK